MSRFTTFAMAPFDGKYRTSYVMVIVMWVPSVIINATFANKKETKFDLENEG